MSQYRQNVEGISLKNIIAGIVFIVLLIMFIAEIGLGDALFIFVLAPFVIYLFSSKSQ